MQQEYYKAFLNLKDLLLLLNLYIGRFNFELIPLELYNNVINEMIG